MPELSHLTEEDRILVRRLLDQGQKALSAQKPVYADFLDPRQRELVGRELAVLPGLRCLYYGGYRRAERQRLVLAADCLLMEAVDPGLAYVQISAPAANALTHQDYLGAILSLGLKREKIGDLVVLESGCQAVVAEEIAPLIQTSLRRVGRGEVSVAPIEPEQLQVPPEREKEIRTTVASPRLDAVASDGFGESRTRMAREIKAGRVRVNWQPVLKPDHLLQAGDVISIRGRGRVILAEVTGTTKKGRLGLVLKRMT
ncbi:MAG: RNA-binding protein [Bacteroidota bacterium]